MVIRTSKQKQRPTATPPPTAAVVPPVPDLAASIQGIADVIFKALEAPLRAQVEACVQSIVHEATRDIHARIVAEISRIQPINIPINLFAQTTPAITPAPIATPTPAPVSAHVEEEEEEAVEEVEEVEEIEEIYDAEDTEEAIEAQPEAVAPEPEPEPQPELKTEKSEPQPLPTSPVTARPRKTLSITVVGLKPGQAHMIKSEFRFLKLHFIPSDAGAGPQLKSLAKTNDYIVQMTDFIRHAVTDSVKAANGNGNWIYISGGMTKLREKLQELSQGHSLPA